MNGKESALYEGVHEPGKTGVSYFKIIYLFLFFLFSYILFSLLFFFFYFVKSFGEDKSKGILVLG